MMKVNSRWKSVSINILLLMFSILFIVVCLEIIFRLFHIRGYHKRRTREWHHALVPEKDRIPGVQIQFKPHSQFDFNYDSNPRGYFNHNNGLTYHINNYGFRGIDYDMHKPPQTKRIMVLGDSFTFGEGVKLHDTFSHQLQKILRRHVAAPVEVLNFGVSGWGTKDEINYLAYEGLQFEPDIVLIVYVLNDADHTGGLDLWYDFRMQYEKKGLGFSYLLSYCYARIARTVYARKYIDQLTRNALQAKHQWEESFAYLSKGEELTKSRNIKYAVIIFPFMYELNDHYPFVPIHQLIYRYCLTHNIVVLDLLDAFKGQHYTELWVHPSDQHPNIKGHQIAADAISEFILENGLLD